MRAFAALSVVFLLAAPAAAAEPDLCRNGYFPAAAGHIRLAVVTAPTPPPVPYTQDWIGCPGPACGAVHRGDRLLVSQAEEGRSCAWHPRRFGDDVGWLPSDALTVTDTRAPDTRDWIGAWTPVNGGPTIRIRGAADGTSLHVDGNARWYGGRVAVDGEPVVHFGSFSGDGAPRDGVLTIVDTSDCEVRMQWIAGFVVAADNAQCGGANVRFDAVYRRGLR